MKPFMTKFWVRLVAVVVFISMVIVAILSAAGIWACLETRVYADDGAQLRKDVLDSLACRMDSSVQEYYLNYRNDPNGAQDYWAPFFSAERTNYFFQVKDKDGNVILSSYSAPYQYHSTDSLEDGSNVQYIEKTFESAAKRQAWMEEFSDKHRIWSDSQWEDQEENRSAEYHIEVEYSEPSTITIDRYIAKDLKAKDKISIVMHLTDRVIAMKNVLPWICGISVLLALAALIFLMVLAGRREDGSVRLTWFDKIPLDLLVVIYLGLVGVTFAILEECYDFTQGFIAAAALLPVWTGLITAFFMTAAVRAKAGTFWKNNITAWVLNHLLRFCKWFWGALKVLLKNIPLFWKTLIVWACVSFVEFLVIANTSFNSALLFCWFVEKLILTPLILFGVIGLQRLRKGAADIRKGDLEQKVDTKYLYGPFREHAEDLNSITQGLQNAVEDRVKSERMKAELITNVSHDIKTPLTSIVNYVDLLSKEELQNAQAKEYISVLTRQSARLKKLTEDLVEASKASTGNIEVHAEPVDLNVLLGQAAGEYSDRFAQKNLEAVLTTAAEQPKILADGQLLWRTFSNLLTNIVKYALPGTRVYLSTALREKTAYVTFRNISDAPLNISGDELTERFVRGERSRTDGEGSGLGLSIARSLTELQGGVFTVTVDGDLFKAELSFPVMQ